MKKRDNRHFHVADSSVLLDLFAPDNEKLRAKSKDYLDHYGRIYKGGISIITLGEIVKKILAVKDARTRQETLITLSEFLADSKTEILKINDKDTKLALELKEMDYAVDMPELISLAAAIRNKARVFMVAETALYESKIKGYVKEKYRIAVQRIL